MKRLVKTWGRLRSTRMLALRFDRPRRIDRFIDYFGGRLTLVMVHPARRKSCSRLHIR